MKNRYVIIKKNSDFQKIFEKGHSISGRYIVVYFLPNFLAHHRFGFCVGKKLGTAVTRNRIKRQLREAAAQYETKNNLGLDILFVAKASVLSVQFNSIIDEISHILGIADLRSSKAYKKMEDSP